MSADELDVDAELLAMAGDDSSEDEGSDAGEIVDDAPAPFARSHSEEPKPSVEKSEEQAQASKRGVAQKVKKRGGRKKVSRREIQDELADLADSPSPSASPRSDAMDGSMRGSPQRASPSPSAGEPLFPIDGTFYSIADRDDIMALPEIERETILADRAQAALKRQQDIQLKQMLASQAAARNKRKATAADLDDAAARKSSRPKTDKTGRSALDDYKKAREAKGAERSSRFDRRSDRKRDSRSASSASDRDADGESEVEWADSAPTRREEPPPDLKDFERCRIGRTAFAKICFYPNFEETMQGCYCRVSIGMNRETGQNMYRMTMIKGFTEGKPYMLEAGPNAKSFMCDLYAVVAHGAAEKPWPLSACSDSKFTVEEYEKYMDTLRKDRIRIPKKAHLEQKLDDIHRFLEPQWTEAVLSEKFAKAAAMAKRVDPANIAKVKKERILERKARAEEAGDDEEAARCNAELAALQNNAATNSSTPIIVPKPSPSRPSALSQQDRLAALNQKNRGKNSEDVRKALLEERRKREKAIAEAKAKQAAAAEAKRQQELLSVPGKDGADMRELFGDSDMSRAGTPMSGVSTPKLRRSRQGTPLNGLPKEKSKLGIGAHDADDELGGLDLGIDVEV